MIRNTVRFYVGDQLCELNQFSPQLSLLEWLRVHYGRKGCKEGCNEGDCGACTVCVVHRNEHGLQWKAINACLALVGSLDRAQIFTVEDIKNPDGTLHPVQQAMIDHHGSQCGFCTPGFIMSMVVYSLTEKHYDAEKFLHSLAGNLCRCTGYAPMKKAMQQVYVQREEVHYATSLQEIETLVHKRLQHLEDSKHVEITGPKGRFSAPCCSDYFAELYASHPDALLLAGGSDAGLWMTKKLRTFTHIIALNRIDEFKAISQRDQTIYFGAGVTYKQALPVLGEYFPPLLDFFHHIAGEQIRNVATLCGNIANASPIGDGPPVFIALGARIHLRQGQNRRSLLLEDYFLEYGRQDRKRGEFIEGLSLPLFDARWKIAAYKISRRRQQDISTLLGVFAVNIDATERIEDIRLVFGGMAGVPKRAVHVENTLQGHHWDEEHLHKARQALEKDFTPLSDVRASQWYRMEVAKNLLTRFYAEHMALGAEEQKVPLL